MNPKSLVFAAVTLAACSVGVAQTLHHPIFHVWQAGPGPDPVPLHPDFFEGIVRITRAQVVNEGQPFPMTATEAATAVANEIRLRMSLPASDPDHLDAGQICLSFDGGFARDKEDCDSDRAVQGGNASATSGGRFFNSPLRFFREEDRLTTAAYPYGDDDRFDFPYRHEPYGHSDRTYRNPFLRNADPNPLSIPPLKQWMIDFVAAYQASSPALPPPVYFYLDMEPSKGSNLGHDEQGMRSNSLHMLKVMASDSATWTQRTLPAYFGDGMTLNALYQAERGCMDPDIHNAIDWSLDADADSDHNRPVMLWYDSVMRRAEDAVYKNCFFDVVAQTWPACKTSNYDGMRLDGVVPMANGQPVPNTGWYLGSDDTRKLINGIETYPARLPRNSMPRGRIEKWFQDGSRFWRECNGVWDITRQYTSGMVMSPVLYLLDDRQQWRTWNYEGFGVDMHGHPIPCHQQPNLYLGDSMLPDYFHPPAVTPRLVLETLQESSMRLFRATVEACIESFGGHHEEELVPWVSMNEGGGVGAHPFFMRRLLAMLRAHNVPEVVLFSGLNMDTDFEGGVALWKATRAVIDQVYASHIAEYAAWGGNIINGTGGDPSRLEFVLKDAAGLPRTVDVRSAPNIGPQGQLPTISSLSLDVKVAGLGAYRTQPPPNALTGGHGYMVVIEGTVTLADGACPRSVSPLLTTQVIARNWREPFSFDAIRQVDPVEDEAPQALPPRYSDSSGMIARAPNGNYNEVPFRVVCDLRASEIGAAGAEYVDANGNLTLEIFQHEPLDGATWGEGGPNCTYPWSFVSHIDLVQVIPFPFDAPPPAQYSGPRRPQPVDVANPDYSEWYYSNPIIRRQSGPGGVWEPASLDDAASTPMHYDDWNYANEVLGGHWPDACVNNQHPANSYLLSSAFSVAAGDPNKQTASVKFTLPVWTDASTGDPPNLQPYRVWYWLPDIVQWVDFTSQMVVTIGRGSQGAMSEVTVASTGAHALPPGYYALTLNVLPPTQAGQPYAVYCGGTTGYAQLPAQPNAFLYGAGGEVIPTIQYNFRLYPDCDGSPGCIDPLPEHRCPGTGACPADLDDGSGNGYPDGGVDINDLLFFMPKYEEGNIVVDLDDGTGTGSQDGGVDINDLLFFLTHYEGGC